MTPLRTIVQRSHVRSALTKFQKDNPSDLRPARILGSRNFFNQFYMATLDEYVSINGSGVISALDDDGNPILTKLLDFIKWMYESGFLEFLIGMFSGMTTAAVGSLCLADILESCEIDEE